ncbi:hypothetical protein AeMF1_021148 [Aphanomyces euteiches]|nr:hypothetical protein AeMF1_021148 [Aphanomyces euteiches]
MRRRFKVLHVGQTKRRVAWNIKSLLVTIVLSANVLVLPFEVYLYEVSPFAPPTFEPPSVLSYFETVELNSSLSSQYANSFRLVYNRSTIPSHVTYMHDHHHNIDVLRSHLPHNLSSCASIATLLHHVQGALYFPRDLCAELANLSCSPDLPIDVARTWDIALFGLPKSSSVAWVEPETFQVYYLYVPSRLPRSWFFFKFVARCFIWIHMLRLVAGSYFGPVWHLYKSLQSYPMHDKSAAVRYEIVVGDLTSIVVSNPIVCSFFLFDLWASAEYVGLSCLRVTQTTDWFYFMLGLLNFSRTIWFSLAWLVFLNFALQRLQRTTKFQPVDATFLAAASYLFGPFVTYLQTLFPFVVYVYTIILGVLEQIDPVTGQVVAIDCTIVMLVFSITMSCIPLALGLPKIAKSVTRVAVERVRRMSSHLGIVGPRIGSLDVIPTRYEESSLSFNGFRQRIYFWFFRDGRNVEDVTFGGSIYRLFHNFQPAQVNQTINQRGSDCYVFGYDKLDKLVEVTRISLESRANIANSVLPGVVIQHVQSPCAVGRIVFRGRGDHVVGGLPSIVVHHGVDKSPWLA